MLDNIMCSLIALEINLSTPKRSKKKLQKILKEYDFDDDFIENINEDTLEGFEAAISIVEDIIRSKRN